MHSLSPRAHLLSNHRGPWAVCGLSAVGPDGPPVLVTCELWRTHVSYHLVFLIPRAGLAGNFLVNLLVEEFVFPSCPFGMCSPEAAIRWSSESSTVAGAARLGTSELQQQWGPCRGGRAQARGSDQLVIWRTVVSTGAGLWKQPRFLYL